MSYSYLSSPKKGTINRQISWTGTRFPVPAMLPRTSVAWFRAGSPIWIVMAFWVALACRGFAGVDHFEWGSVPASMEAGQSVAVTVTARDAGGVLVTDYVGTVAITGKQGETATSGVLWGGPVHQDFLWVQWGPRTGGYAFTPWTDLWVTHFRHYFGERVSVWSNDGVLLADRRVQSEVGVWRETPLTVPLRLHAGRTYRVTVRSEVFHHYYRTDRPREFEHGLLGPSYIGVEDGFPTSETSDYQMLVDLRYHAGGESIVPLSPGNSGRFLAGVWSGTVTMDRPAAAMVLHAEDGAGHQGDSMEFQVHAPKDVALRTLEAREWITRDDEMRYVLTVTNRGPGTATGLIVTNVLSTDASFLQVETSHGTHTNLGGVVRWEVGDLASGGHAEMALKVSTGSGDLVVLRSGVARDGLDGTYHNNSVVLVTRVHGPPAIEVGDAQVLEANKLTHALVPVSLWPPSSLDVSVLFETSNANAFAGVDYIRTTGELVFPAGTTNRVISIDVPPDLLNEHEETFTVRLRSATNATIARAIATVRILDDDPLPALSVADATVHEGSGITNQLVFELALSAPSGRTVQIGYATAGLTATPGVDFTPVWGTAAFPPGVTQSSIAIPLRGDYTSEENETILFQLHTPTGAVLLDDQAVGTILDDDPVVHGAVNRFVWDPLDDLQQVSISFPARVRAVDAFGEPASGFNGLVTLTGWSGEVRRPVRVITFTGFVETTREHAGTLAALANHFTDFIETRLGTTSACQLEAHLAEHDVLLVPAQRLATTNMMFELGESWAGALRRFVDRGGIVIVCGSALHEEQILTAGGLLEVGYSRSAATLPIQRTANHILSAGVPASFTGATSTGYHAASSGTTVFRDSSLNAVVIARSWGKGHVILIGCDYAQPGSPMDRVLANAVRWARGKTLSTTPSAPVALVNGEWSGLISVSQQSEAAYLIADDGKGRVGASGSFRVVATNDLGLAWGSLPAAVTVNGHHELELTIWNTGPTATGVKVTNVWTGNVNQISATPSQGTATTTSSNLVWSVGNLPSGATAVLSFQFVPLGIGEIELVAEGRRVEPELDLSNNSARLAFAALPGLAVAVNDMTIAEGDERTSLGIFEVTLNGSPTNTVTVDFVTLGNTAAEGEDYDPISGTLTFEPYCTRQTVIVPIIGDESIETDETFFLQLSQPNNALIARAQAVGTIVNDDLPVLTVHDAVLLEGNAGTSLLQFRATLAAPAPFPVSVDYATTDGTARAGVDYLPSSGRLHFPPGTVERTVPVAVLGDVFGEPSESFILSLDEAQGTILAGDRAIATVLDDDPTALSIEPVTTVEGDTGSTEALVTVRLVPASDHTVAVRYASEEGTAVAGQDYQAVAGELVFPPGITARTLAVPVFGDLVNEADEAFLVRLVQATGAPIGSDTALCRILNDDPVPSLSIANVSALEGNTGSKELQFAVHLSAASEQTVSVDFATVDGTAVAGSDYVATLRTLVFPPKTTIREIAVQVLGDRVDEPAETFHVQLSSPIHAGIAVAQAIGTIVNDDAAAGILHHLEWAPIASSQRAGHPFAVELTARDADGWVVSGFTNSVILGTAKAGGPDNYTIESDLAAHHEVTVAPSTWGYRFTPNTNLLVTHLRHYTGTRISLWKDSGELLVAADVSAPPGQWADVKLDEGVRLFAGHTYRLALFTGSAPYHVSYTSFSTFPHGVINQSCSSSGDAFPEVNDSSTPPLVDVRYTVDVPIPGAVTPASSGSFVNGVWSGPVTVNTQPGPIYLGADAGEGRTGFTPVFELMHDNDLLLALGADRALVYQGDTVQITLTVTNTGPGLAAGIVVTNSLPSGLSFLSAGATAGTWSRTGNTMSWNLGTLAGNSRATLTIRLSAIASGTWTNLAGLTRQGSDAWPANNSASLVLPVHPAAEHFVFAPLTDPQQANVPFPVTITAKNAWNQTVTNFNATVTVSASQLFHENFEDGDFDGWLGLTTVWSSPEFRPSLEITEETAGEGRRSLTIFGSDGATKTLGNIVPDRVTFRMRLWADMPVGFFDLYGPTGERIHFGTHPTLGLLGLISEDGIVHGAPYQAGRWYRVELVFHWTGRTLDYYLDGQLVAGGVSFADTGIHEFTSLTLGSHIANQTWWDDIQFLGDAGLHDAVVLPTPTFAMTNGVGTLLLAIDRVATDLQLTVRDVNNRRGLSATFDVLAGPHGMFDHLAWGSIEPPVLVDRPFHGTLRAIDSLGNLATNFSGPVAIHGKRRDQVEVLVFAGYSDFGSAFSNTLAAVSANLSQCRFTVTTNLDVQALSLDLIDKDVLLVPYQALATGADTVDLATKWRDGLDAFVRTGGVVIVCGDANFLAASGLMVADSYGSTGWTVLRTVADHLLTEGLAPFFDFNDSVVYFHNSDAEPVVTLSPSGEKVVLSRDLGLGHVVLFGTGFFNIGSPLDQVLANSVRWAQSRGLAPVELTLPGPISLIHGEWNGEIGVSEPAERLFLLADAGGWRTAFSEPFSVGVTNDIALSLDLSTNQVVLGTPIECTLVITNHGSLPATGVVVTNWLPAGASVSLITTSQGTVQLSGDKWIGALGTLPSGAQAAILFTLTPHTAGLLQNHATASRVGPDFYLGNNQVTRLIQAWPPPALSVLDTEALEGNTEPSPMIFQIRLFPPAASTVTVDWHTRDGTAQAGIDYVAANGRLEFPSGTTNRTVAVNISEDLLSEEDETVLLVLTNSHNAVISKSVGIGTINDDNDQFPLFQLDSAMIDEGDLNQRDLLFTARLSGPSGRRASVHYRTVSGSASAGLDYVEAEGDLVFPPGITERSFVVRVHGDLLPESDEVLLVELGSASNLALAYTQVGGVIRDDDALPGRLNHFVLSRVGSPQSQGQPFNLTVTARDCLGQLLPDATGPIRIQAHTGNAESSSSVLLFSRYLDNSRSNGILAALSHHLAKVEIHSTDELDPATLEVQLAGHNAFLVPPGGGSEQMAVLGEAWKGTLERFVRGGGVVIVLSDNYDEHLILARSGLLDAQKIGTYFPDMVTNVSTTRLTRGVPESFLAPSITTYLPSHGEVVLARAEDGMAVAVQQVSGAGTAILLGTGFFQDGSPMDRVLANAVTWNDGGASRPLSLTPSEPIILTDGAWTGTVTLLDSSPEAWLQVDGDAGQSGTGNRFTIEPRDTDGDGMPDDWEALRQLDPEDPSDATLDGDGDGLTSLEEYLAGTDPADNSSQVSITAAWLDSDAILLEFIGVQGRFYQIDSTPSASPGVWSMVVDMIEGFGAPQRVRVPLVPDDQARFFRLKASFLQWTASLDHREPHIFLQPLDQVTQRGQSAQLDAIAGGAQPLHYQWRFEGHDISGATNSTLVIDPVRRTDDGNYSVVIDNEYGAVESGAVHLRVDHVLSWGSGEQEVPPGLSDVIDIAAGDFHSLAVTSSGHVIGWPVDVYGASSPPPDLTNAIAVAAGYTHSIALRADGTVVGWGMGALGQTDVPPNLNNVVAIASGRDFCAALRSDGRVAAWGDNNSGQTNVPIGLNRVVAIACGMAHTIALRDDGTVVAWGVNAGGQSTVPEELRNVVAIAAAGNHNLALHSDGTVTAWGGMNWYGETTVPHGLSNVVGVGAGAWHSLAILEDGTLVGWGQVSVPPRLRNVRAVRGGWSHTVVLVEDTEPD